MKDYSDKVRESAAFLRKKLGPAPKAAVVLGSGLGEKNPGYRSLEEIRFDEIPFFPGKALAGHQRIIRILSCPERVCFMHGRYHLYEGLSVQEVVFPVRVLAEWGVQVFFLTNSAASLRDDFAVGELMLIRDHIGFFVPSPLPWPGREGQTSSFTDMSGAYDAELRRAVAEQAGRLGMSIHEGIYTSLPGPAFETPAEIDLLRSLRTDAVGMSTIPEVIALRNLDKRVAAVSCLTNYGAGMKPEILSHSDVVKMASQCSSGMMKLLMEVIRETALF